MFQHPRPQIPVHVDCCADDASGDLVRFEVSKTGPHPIPSDRSDDSVRSVSRCCEREAHLGAEESRNGTTRALPPLQDPPYSLSRPINSTSLLRSASDASSGLNATPKISNLAFSARAPMAPRVSSNRRR